MAEYVIETQNLSKSYGDFQAVQNVDMNVEKGKIYGLLGRNGAGKTTTMCMLLGLTEPTEGSIKLFGLDARDGKNRKEIYTKIGSIIETPGFYPQLNAHENLKIFSKLRGDYNPENIEKVLKLVNLSDEKKPFRNYSLGMKQRLGLAAALVHEPELLILDEPINGLDPAGIVEIRDMLLDITSKLGITVLISSHILSEIELLADEIGIISQGKLIKELTKEELGEQSTKSVIIEVDNIGLAEDMMIKNGYVKDSDFKVDNNEIILLTDIDSRSKINESFVKNGIQVNELHLKEENLEEYFMRLINEGI
ncbi:MAG: ABC transporter ATP-binding protein [Methanobrevibacter sp.]|nr:ABC transporter ATP-binding protein [Methanobrevibacter sp.]MBO6105716.1 ABC transporter ATP-binding protein [Methanobrevibacter sp.]MBO7159033.1 ABC transporter ATP-binding protein [Methanobrevibacter sp.]MBO7211458.1 ABC transporter ATP-binding protein [Methanobrevibacter sp.]MBO7241934.1 ABC transporter ATP-binding protein [Methanobrevibacter sp.]